MTTNGRAEAAAREAPPVLKEEDRLVGGEGGFVHC